MIKSYSAESVRLIFLRAGYEGLGEIERAEAIQGIRKSAMVEKDRT